MSLFNDYYDDIYDTEEEKITQKLEWYALDVVKNIDLDDIRNHTYKTPHDNNFMSLIRLYNNLKNLLLYKANNMITGSFNPIQIVKSSYIEILAIVNNRKCYNEVTLLSDTILSLNMDSANAILKDLELVEKDNNISIYDKLDYLKDCVASYKKISPVITRH